jgi:tRNA (cmo5U34)-methyltransferase
MNEFNGKARDWDKNQMHIERSQVIAGELLKMIHINKKMKALEFGAGTGLLSFILKDEFEEIILMDSSEEMIKVTNEKIIASDAKNLKTLWIDLEKEDYNTRVDVIFNQMVLHHVNDIKALITKFYSLLNPGGYLAIADLYVEDGSFHGKGFSGHKGFDVEELSLLLLQNGYKNIKHKQCFIMMKVIESGRTIEFPIFLLVASK